jgi:hypothetical protein
MEAHIDPAADRQREERRRRVDRATEFDMTAEFDIYRTAKIKEKEHPARSRRR